MSERILFVDDDPNILQGLKRQLRRRYDVDTALCGDEGLKAVKERGPFAVVVSDMRMPGMDGVQFLCRVRELSGDTVRVMLTGNADQQTAADAVNEGHIFRFLSKPCSAEQIAKTLDAGLQQYRLITAERELLSKTLSGSVGVLTEVLALTKPQGFGRTAEVRGLVRQLCEQVRVENAWEVELAASLAQLGYITLREATMERIAAGLPLSEEEQRAYDNQALVGSRLVAKIPRLQNVGKAIAYQGKLFDGRGVPDDGIAGGAIPLGARILKLALDFDALRASGEGDEAALEIILERRGAYDPDLVAALRALVRSEYVVRQVRVGALSEGMVLESNVCAETGEILIAGGREITQVMIERLRAFARQRNVREPVAVRIPAPDGDGPATPEASLALANP